MTLSAKLILALVLLPSAAQGDGPVILDFHASWCAPCRQMRPVVQKLLDKQYPVRSIDVDDAQELAERYQITGVPTFVVIDSSGEELARVSGVRPATELAALYNDACNELASRASPPEDARPSSRPAIVRASAGPDDAYMPKPWETVVRIKVIGKGSVGFGSGTVIASSPEQSIILTCAHIFSVEGARQQPTPAEFNRKIQVDLFDGKLHGLKPAVVHPVESVEAEVLDYDFTMDVGLIRIRPGRVLPATPVVRESWQPEQGAGMTTVGCSEGNDATAWSTVVTNPEFQGLVGNRRYEAIECHHAPKQGRSGGGLYTLEGYLAGVCNFAEPRGGHGLYASPKSIYRLLDRNNLTLCYRPEAGRRDQMLASNTGNPASAPVRTIVRGQSGSSETAGIPMPDPSTAGIRMTPVASAAAPGWQSPGSRTSGEDRLTRRPVVEDGAMSRLTTDLQMNPAVAGVHDHMTGEAGDPAEMSQPSAVSSVGMSSWRAAGVPASASR